MKKSRILSLALLVGLILSLSVLLSGCANKREISTDGMFLVIYDGNGGYLGNKATTVRKLYCTPGDPIPDYPTEYTDKQNTVSSLGLAMKSGYALKGWYTSADYEANENGAYVYLSADDNNGVYELDNKGQYVFTYVEDENGEFIDVSIEYKTTVNDEGETVNDETVSYIYVKEAVLDEEKVLLSPGFYIYNEETLNDGSMNELVVNAYKAAAEEKKFSYGEANKLSGFILVTDLNEADSLLLNNEERYTKTFVEATEKDIELDHYSLKSDYAFVDDIFVTDLKGNYVSVDGRFILFDEENEDHAGLARYSIDKKYVFTPTEAKISPADLDRYEIEVKYWDFDNDRVTEDVVDENRHLTLKAHWVKKTTVFFHYNNNTEQVDEMTTKLLPDNTSYEDIKPGMTIGKKEIIPRFADHTFVCWSKTEGEYDPWDFDKDIFPENANELHLHAYYIDGVYNRVDSVKTLEKVWMNPSGDYLLVKDIDLGGKTFDNVSPLKLSENIAFTGKFISFGKTIKNFTISVSSTKSVSNAVNALFPAVNGATISGINVDCNLVINVGKLNAITKECNLGVSALAFNGGENESVIENCTVNATLTVKGTFASEVNYNLTAAELFSGDNIKATDCTATLDTSKVNITNMNVKFTVKK